MNVGEMIRTFRQKRGLSQGDLEKRSGLMRCYISRVENGHTVPSLETLTRIARALETELSDMFQEDRTHDPQEADFLRELRAHLPSLTPRHREHILEMVRKMVEG
jgi:transcriptional regulator with XRE-family HTH domain